MEKGLTGNKLKIIAILSMLNQKIHFAKTPSRFRKVIQLYTRFFVFKIWHLRNLTDPYKSFTIINVGAILGIYEVKCSNIWSIVAYNGLIFYHLNQISFFYARKTLIIKYLTFIIFNKHTFCGIVLIILKRPPVFGR